MNIGIIGCGAISSQYMIGLNEDKTKINVIGLRQLSLDVVLI